MSKIRDAMRKSEEELWEPGTAREIARPEAPPMPEEGPRGLIPALSSDVLSYYEAIGKQIEVALGELESRTLVFTGAVAGDGISTVVAQYAEMLSRRGDRVLVIDGNPRHPSLHHQFNLPEAPGVAEYLSGKFSREGVVHRTGFANLELVPLGRCSDRSEAGRITEALGRFESLFASDYDYVLVDSDFIGSPFFSQASVASGHGVVLVIRAGKTNREVANRACEIVRRVGGRILGVILNRRQFPIPGFIYRRL